MIWPDDQTATGWADRSSLQTRQRLKKRTATQRLRSAKMR